ncbi:hypothetical protein C8Q80DRAFT_1122969 [Daedaleopsis nitida]|nr:hypothetical protein C8Q80DRAFT_1122969 [Daedaleopsis nitida]
MSSGSGSSPLMTSPELPPRMVHRGRARCFGQATPTQFDWGPSGQGQLLLSPQSSTLPHATASMFNPNPLEQQHPTLPEHHLLGVLLSQQHEVIGSSIGEVAIHSESESSSDVGEVAICSDSASSSNSGEVAIHSESEVTDDEMGDEPDTVQRPQFSGHSVEYHDRLPPRFSALAMSYGTRENWAEEHENDQRLFMQCGSYFGLSFFR